jgi:ornithine--oxo-acid transaminase
MNKNNQRLSYRMNIIETSHKHLANNIQPYSITFVRGKGVYLYDDTGKRYIDMVTGIAVNNFGHRPKSLINTMHKQAMKLSILPRLFYQKPLAQLSSKICTLTGMDKLIPMNSGAEAIETAIKCVRKWAYHSKKVKMNEAEIITCDHSFHGRTITAISTSSIERYKQGFGPLTPGFKSIPYNDVAALKKAITPQTAAFIVEPIQGEAGVIIPAKGYLKACQDICRANNVLLIIDEIQTGMGRTGKLLAFQHECIVPDGLVMGKALGGGLLPISLFLSNDKVMRHIQPGDHGSTFGGNPLACAVAFEALQTLIKKNLCEKAMQMGQYFLNRLQEIKSPIIKEIRGQGLLMAVELNLNKVETQKIIHKLMQQGLLSVPTRENTIRLLPPLTMTRFHIDQAMMILKKVIN